MPSKSKAQHNFMAAVANNPSFAKKVGVPQSVGKEFSNADKNRKFSKGGDMPIKAKDKSLDDMKKDAISSSVAERGYKKGGMAMVNKGGKMVPNFAADGKGKMAKGGMAASPMGKVKTNPGNINGVATKGKTKGKMITMAKGGKAMKSGGRTC